MPESMKGRGENCWICHNGEEFTYLFEESPSPGSGEEEESSAPESPAPSSGTGAAGGPQYALQAPALR
jgi:hypothetical protein